MENVTEEKSPCDAPNIEGYHWLGNSGKKKFENAILAYRHYTINELVALSFRPDNYIKWAVYVKI